MASRARISVCRRLSSSRRPSSQASAVPRSESDSPGSVGRRRGEARAPPGGHRGLDQARHHAGGGQADRVRAVPGGRQVDDAELLAADRVVHGRGPAHPVVHDRGVVLGAEDHRRVAGAAGDGQRVGADALLVPPAARHEVDRLGLAPHHPPAVGPQDAGLGVGDRDDQVAVLGRAPQLGLHALDRGLQGRLAPVGRGVGLVVQRRLGEVGGDRGGGEPPAVADLRSHPVAGPVPQLHERGPGLDGLVAPVPQVAVAAHGPPTRCAAAPV